MNRIITKILFFTLTCIAASAAYFSPVNVSSSEVYYEIEWDENIVSEKDWEKTPIGEYPVNEQSPEWKEMSYCEAVSACNMPRGYAESLATQELVKYAVNYPFTFDIFAYDSVEKGISHLKEISVVFEELLSRPDCMDKMLEEYARISCDYELLEESKDMMKSNYNKKVFLEAFFGVYYDNFSKDEAENFIKEYRDKYEKQPESIQNYSMSRMFYDAVAESIGYIPEEVIFETAENNTVDNDILDEIASSFSFVQTNSSLQQISAGTKCYYGYEIINGAMVECYQYYSGEYDSDEIASINNAVTSQYPSFRKIRNPSKKYNCHSYAWYSESASNILWINNPSKVFSNENYYTKWVIPMVTPGKGDKILFYNGSSLEHSAILDSSTGCVSKLGVLGLYRTTVSEMKTFYKAPATQSYLTR